MSISIRNKKEIEFLRKPNKIVGQTLELLKRNTQVGITLLELDKIAEDFIRSFGARPAFKGLYGFPNAVCISVNEVIIHGIPTNYALKEGDIVGFDVGVELDGWYGDAAISVGVGKISSKDLDLIACAKDTLYEAIKSITTGLRFKELSKIIEQSILKKGFVPLRGFCGHGIGRKPHEEPEIPNYLETNVIASGPKIKEGMIFCLEPMICQRDGEPRILNDKWSVTSVDGLNGSHYEHTIAIVGGKAEILTEI
ncbi:type I methionyl aminopeptidase [Helicobacter cappadocius]|uniref:Methionine aminopeptidase n=1 Tax=Helicobacter cappadocius TaxID=3063998 RepID=A0AA90PTU2_9HELI|nr:MULTISPECIES: type I methionyl aminopeptidase [unclassified Helicobacter]MDO7253502.1 type I methionyl aminopeptidase [Helicobacter sp. faydin-H75]MDP2539429.1 type I methionyl aminopeptidase [Helicobacter sp. faydin-H76]